MVMSGGPMSLLRRKGQTP
jgi:hypothetical protein